MMPEYACLSPDQLPYTTIPLYSIITEYIGIYCSILQYFILSLSIPKVQKVQASSKKLRLTINTRQY